MHDAPPIKEDREKQPKKADLKTFKEGDTAQGIVLENMRDVEVDGIVVKDAGIFYGKAGQTLWFKVVKASGDGKIKQLKI